MQQFSMRVALTALLVAVAPLAVGGASLLRKSGDVPKKDAKIKNPMEHSVGDVLKNAEPEKPEPKGQQYDHMYVPRNEPGKKDTSPTDPMEHFSGWEGEVAQVFDYMSAEEGMVFEGATCKSVCAACTIYGEEQSEGICFCYATCKMGECGNGQLPHIGWSNNEVSSPRTMYEAKCNVGEKNCEAQCMEDSFKKEVQKCKDEKGSPTACFNKLRRANEPLPHDARKQVHWCIKKGLSDCDTFLNVPKEDGWKCFEQQEHCKEQAMHGFKLEVAAQWQAPSVWETVAN